jgi:hypothetical protein
MPSLHYNPSTESVSYNPETVSLLLSCCPICPDVASVVIRTSGISLCPYPYPPDGFPHCYLGQYETTGEWPNNIDITLSLISTGPENCSWEKLYKTNIIITSYSAANCTGNILGTFIFGIDFLLQKHSPTHAHLNIIPCVVDNDGNFLGYFGSPAFSITYAPPEGKCIASSGALEWSWPCYEGIFQFFHAEAGEITITENY